MYKSEYYRDQIDALRMIRRHLEVCHRMEAFYVSSQEPWAYDAQEENRYK